MMQNLFLMTHFNSLSLKTLISRIMQIGLILLSSLSIKAETRSWSNREGKTIQAELVNFDIEGKKVTLRLSNGKEVPLALDTLSDKDQAWLTERQRTLEDKADAVKAMAGKTVSYQSDGPEAVSYHVYYPTGYQADAPPAMIIMFSPGGGGKAILGSVKEACEALGWIGVGCDAFKNNSDEAILDQKWKEVLPHIEKTVMHNKDLLYLGGMSGGALRAYDYSESSARPWKGILAFGGWMGGKQSLNCPPKMAVAIVNGDSDANANSVIPRDQGVLEKERCKVKTFSFKGGHVIAPPDVTLEAMQWLKKTTVEGNRLSAGKRSPTPLDPDLKKVK